jgi:hypothetical protein
MTGDSLIEPANGHKPMCDDEHLRVCQACSKHVLYGHVGSVVEIGGTLVHDEEGGGPEFE